MFGWKLIRESELALQSQLTETRIASLAASLRETQRYAEKCEALLDHERERIDSERERADRIADSLFQNQGLPAVSPMVLGEQRAEAQMADKNREDYRKQLDEIFGETLSDLEESGAEDILKEAAAAPVK
jgi:hypothetical protein